MSIAVGERMKTYLGERNDSGVSVKILRDAGRQRPLPLYLTKGIPKTVKFGWGSASEEASQLALSLLYDFLGPENRDIALKLHARFRDLMLAPIRVDVWELSENEMRRAVLELMKESEVRIRIERERDKPKE